MRPEYREVRRPKRRSDPSRSQTLVDIQKKRKGLSQIVFIIYLFILAFLGLFAYMIHFQIIKADDLSADPRNPLLKAKEEKITLGNIYASDGQTILAKTEKTEKGTKKKSLSDGGCLCPSHRLFCQWSYRA